MSYKRPPNPSELFFWFTMYCVVTYLIVAIGIPLFHLTFPHA